MKLALTKNDMSRVIVQALFNLNTLPAADHPRVKSLAKNKKAHLESQYKLAHKVLTDSVRNQ
jgi:hypothetical protein